MVFKGRGFTSGRQELGSVFSVAVCKIQASKHYAESLSLVLKDRRRFAVQLPLDCVLGFAACRRCLKMFVTCYICIGQRATELLFQPHLLRVMYIDISIPEGFMNTCYRKCT